MTTLRPSLLVQTVRFDASDREAALRLGRDLYARLTRPPEDPLAYGAGIPVLAAVAAEEVDLEAADLLVLVPVLGKETFALRRKEALATLGEWHERLGDGHVLAVPTAAVWRGVEERLPGVPLLTELSGGDDRRRRTLDEVVLALARLLDGGERVRLFVSHARADLPATGEAARRIHAHVVTDTTGRAFFDARDLEPGHGLETQLEGALGHGLLLVVRSDAYSTRPWCQRELLLAKRHGLPTLTVEVLRRGELRSLAYAGNGPSLVWQDDAAAEVASRAMVEVVRAAAFGREARRVIDTAGLPADTAVLCRPPELLDLAQGPLAGVESRVALHPDPELPVAERDVLRLARSRLRLVTPTTAYRRHLERRGPSNPLEGLQVAMSLSKSPDVEGEEGFTEEHVRDAVTYLARSLVSAGAAIAYGGDFRAGGYTEVLGRLIAAYNETAAAPAELLHHYAAAPTSLEEMPDDLLLEVHHLGRPPFAANARLPSPTAPNAPPPALYLSDLRRVMAEKTDARVLLGGKTLPRLEAGDKGYGGRLPGVAEEAWRTLEAGRPLYVAGGYGGAAGRVAELLLGGETPPELRDETWLADDAFRRRAAAIDGDPAREALGLPRRLEDLAGELRRLGAKRLASDEASRAWNGLTVEENRELFCSRDPVTIARLVLEGLFAVARRRAADRLRIELVRGSVNHGRDLDAVAVAVFEDVPLGGAGAALDRALAGHASWAHARGHALTGLASSDVDADWLYLASLGSVADLGDELERRIAAASRDAAAAARRHGFRRLGVVAFGGALARNVQDVVAPMLEGLSEAADETTVVWFENDPSRHAELRERLQSEPSVSLTTRQASAVEAPAAAGAGAELLVIVRLEDSRLHSTILPPAGTGLAKPRSAALDGKTLEALSRGREPRGRRTPELEELDRRGRILGELLFGDAAAELLAHCRDARVTVIHDPAAARLPFEVLLGGPEDGEPVRPAAGAGLSRRLAARGIGTAQLLGRPPRAGRLAVLMVVNPTEDLDGVEKEARAVRALLEKRDNVELTELWRDEAGRDAVVEAMAGADVLHYGGHAFYEGPGEAESGLFLHGDEPLTLADLRGRDLPVRLAFVNSCESGRVRGRGKIETEAAAFAELFLRSGIEAYLGTYWRVGDAAAAAFAARVYGALAAGERLETAVRRARAALLADGEPDWGNYLLYGDGRFRLVSG